MGKNSDMDVRHANPSVIQAPDESCDVHCVRCEACRRTVTEWEARVYGMCPRCNHTRFRGMSKAWGWDALRLAYWFQFKRWQVHGPMVDPKGYDRAKVAWKKKQAASVEDVDVVTPL
jgi:hypothetical protein